MNRSCASCALLLLAAQAACSDPIVVLSSPSSSASSGSGGASAASSGASTASSGASSSSGSSCPSTAPPSGACAPPPSCLGSGSPCLAHLDQSASTRPGFRMVQLDLSKPVPVPPSAVLVSDPACNLHGSGGFSWLLRFDTVAGTLETGFAAPTSSGPYVFVDEPGIHPVTAPAVLSAACTFDAVMGDVNAPVYLDAAATMRVVLPLRSLRFHDAAVSADLGCIGRYDAAGLDPASACQPDGTHPPFLDGGALDAFMLLEDTDAVIISSVNESLCVLLAGGGLYGTKNPGGVNVCARDASNKIVFSGDWCAATNAAATPTCADAVQLTAQFAAQAVAIQ